MKKIILFILFPILSFSQPMRYIDFGMSMGYLTGLHNYDGAIQSAVKYGVKTYRFYDLFSKGTDTNVAHIADEVNYMINTKGASVVLLSLSCNAYSKLTQDTTGRHLTARQKEIAAYTNRSFPKDTVAYIKLLKRLANELKSRPYFVKGFPIGNLLDHTEFEFNSEIDAASYFWGTFDEAVRLFRIDYNALKEFNRPMITGSYTSRLMSDTTGKSYWYKYYTTDTIYNHTGFSNSMYWIDSSNPAKNDTNITFHLNSNNYPVRNYNYTYITEYNLYTGVLPGSLREICINNITFIKYFTEMLTWVYNTRPYIQRIYFQTLCEPIQRNDNDLGILGIWKLNTDTITHRTWYTIKPCGTMFYDMLKVVKDGYIPTATGLKGKDYSLVFNANRTAYIVVSNIYKP